MKNRIKKIKVLAMDVDGVLTDGKIIHDSDGKESKHFDVQDGYGIVIFQRTGMKTAIISARSAKSVMMRAEDLRIDKVYQDAYPKVFAYETMLKDFGVADKEVCFIGDDLPDVPILRRVGFPVAVRNASRDVKAHAKYVTRKVGGAGAVREVIELILKTQGKWKKILESY
jgi:3-deoxy-D-manno-octulosonate 8-phosphate phosphatase (KDO 8-P phosphatase)